MEKVKFEKMNLSAQMKRAVAKMGLETATSVQTEAIPSMLEWKDIIAKAPTGTGKTFAFGIPIIEQIDVSNENIQALILSPTRELALQICAELRALYAFKEGIRAVAVYGGQPIEQQMRAFKRHPQIVVATPGRLTDHLKRKSISLSGVKTVILDEADRMLDMGFVKEVTRILDLTSQRKNLALFSATISRQVMDIGWIYQRDAVEITIPEDKENKPVIAQYSLDATGSKKTEAVLHILNEKGYEKAIVFCNTKRMVKKLTKTLVTNGILADCIHGEIPQNVRERVMNDFRKGTFRILVATDVAARGIDIDNVDAVFNYDIPDENEYYLHRIGRTGRAKKHGVSYTFVSYEQSFRLKEIIKYTGSKIVPLQLTAN